MLIAHAGLGGWPDWSEYVRWCGKVWEWEVSEHPIEESTLIWHAGHDSDGTSRTAWLPVDEVFIKLKDTASVEVLAEVEVGRGRFPGAWKNREFPNVVSWVPGHQKGTWLLPAVRQGILLLFDEAGF